MTLLSICTNVADMTGVARPAQIIGATDRTARQMLALLNRGGKALAKQKNAWGGTWQALERLHSFSTAAGEDEYALPSDYESLLGDTVWDRSNFWEVRGPASPRLWQQVRSGLQETSQLRKLFRIRRIVDGSTGDRKFTIEPEPAAIETVVFEYASNAWVANAAGDAFKAAFTVDTDTALLDENLHELDLMWRFKHAKGLEFAADLAEFEQERDRKIAAEVGATVMLARPRMRLFPVNTPDTGFGA